MPQKRIAGMLDGFSSGSFPHDGVLILVGANE